MLQYEPEVTVSIHNYTQGYAEKLSIILIISRTKVYNHVMHFTRCNAMQLFNMS